MKKTILIYDDDVEILHLCKAILHRPEYHIETKERCELILQDVARIKPDIIVMDLWIPSIGGEKAIGLLKSDPTYSNIPVIVFSAHAKLKEIYLNINANDFIEKPFDITHFKSVIENHLSGIVSPV